MGLLDLVALATVADVAPSDRREPRPRAAGSQGHGAARTSRSCRALRCRPARKRTDLPITSALCSARGSMRAGGSGRRTLARGCSPKPTARSAGHGRTARTAQHRTARDRRPRSVPPPSSRPRSAGSMVRWSGPRAKAGTRGRRHRCLATQGTHGAASVVIGLDGDEGQGLRPFRLGRGPWRSIQRRRLRGAAYQRRRSQHGGWSDRCARHARSGDGAAGNCSHGRVRGRVVPSICNLDGVLMPGAASVDLIEQLDRAGPFGAGAAAPRFVFPDVTIRFAKRVRRAASRSTFGDGLGASQSKPSPSAPSTARSARRCSITAARVSTLPAGSRSTNGTGAAVQLRLEDAARA